VSPSFSLKPRLQLGVIDDLEIKTVPTVSIFLAELPLSQITRLIKRSVGVLTSELDGRLSWSPAAGRHRNSQARTPAPPCHWLCGVNEKAHESS
jgi:hypothetical protein